MFGKETWECFPIGTVFFKFVWRTLSEQQRIILARALAQKTDCLILDEPTNHLDIKYQLQLLDIVKSLGVTVIGAANDLNIARQGILRPDLSALRMKNGRLVACGTPEEVITEDFIHMLYEVDATVKRG